MKMNKKKLILFAPLAIVGVALFIALGGEIVMQLWNWLLPSLFGWRQITFWQALGILVLCRILFGGLGGHGGRGFGRSRAPHGGALGAHDARGAGEIPARDGTVWVRSAAGESEGV